MTDCGLGANYEYDNNGALIKTECDNGLTTTYTRDSRGRLESLRAGFAGETALLDAKYTYDGNGNRTSRNEKFFMQNDRTQTSAVTQYAYDSMNRLTMENRNGLATSYTYDMAGNRTGRLKGDDKEEYRYNSRNQLTELTGMGRRTSYQYDPAGNLTQEQRFIQERAETRKYTYDAYNRNTEVRGEDFLHKNFYDAEGLRNRIEENGKATDFVYSGDMLYSEREVNSTRERRYILGNEYLGHEDTVQDVTFSGENQKQEYSYITDEQGSLRYILNADRQTETCQEYSAFGERIFQEGASSRLGYNSQMGDELTGLTYLRARYYNPEIGKFTQEDIIYDDGFNLYAYCGSNPVIYCDPIGFAKTNMFSIGGNSKSVKGSITNNPDFIVTPEGVALPTNQDFNLVSTSVPTDKGGEYLQIHTQHAHGSLNNPHTHRPQINIDPSTGISSSKRVSDDTKANDINYNLYMQVIDKYMQGDVEKIWVVENIHDMIDDLEQNLNIIDEICQKSELMVFWYGTDFEDLDEIFSRQHLMSYLKENINNPCLEIYLIVNCRDKV